MNQVKFKFGEPQHGWVDFKISDSVHEIILDVSDVPNNCLESLALALNRLQEGSIEQEVEFSLEPVFAILRFNVNRKTLNLEVFPDESRVNSIKFYGPKNKVLHQLYKGLKDLGSLDCWQAKNALENIWSWEFPYKELNEYKEKNV